MAVEISSTPLANDNSFLAVLLLVLKPPLRLALETSLRPLARARSSRSDANCCLV